MDKAIIGQLEEISALLSAVGRGEGLDSLGQTLPGFSSQLYEWAMAVAENIMMPVAMSVLALFFMLELHSQATRAQNAGAGEAFAAELVFKTLFKAALCKEALGMAPRLMEGIYNASALVTKAIMGQSAAAAAFSAAVSASGIKPVIDDMDLFSQLMALMACWLVKLAAWSASILANIIIIGRLAEIYLMVALSPLPMATFPNSEMSQIGKSFLKGFAALCAQGAAVFLSLSFYPVLAGPIIEKTVEIGSPGDLNAALGQLLMCSALFIAMVASSRKFANALFGLGQ